MKKILEKLRDDKEYYGGEVTIFPRESLLLLFPSWMPHMVMPESIMLESFQLVPES